MGNIVKKIVLTGGPCAGKTDSLELIEKYLRNKEYIVYTVQESATELINSGIKPFGKEGIGFVAFQYILFNYQLFKEKMIEDNALNSFKYREVIILYDRALLDGKAYINELEFSNLLKYYNYNEVDLLNKYDLVIHLETGAKGEFYTVENNDARSEDRDEAIDLDNKTYNAWINHGNLYKVKCNENFDNKKREILDIINSEVNKISDIKK